MRHRGGAQRIPRPPGARPGGVSPWAGLPVAARTGIGVDRVRSALAPLGPGRPPDAGVDLTDLRTAAVLVPLFDEGGEARVLLTRRSTNLSSHRGDVAFPGGRQDPGEELVWAALREAREEVGIEPASVMIVGELDRITTLVSRYDIAPFVGVLPGRPILTVNPAEIDRAFDVGLAELLDDGVFREERWEMPWGERDVSFFELEGETVWGATARILRHLLALVTAGDGVVA